MEDDSPHRRLEDALEPRALGEPTNRQRIDSMDETVHQIQIRLQRFTARAMAIMVALALMTAVSIGGFALVLSKRGHDLREVRHAAAISKWTAVKAADLAKQTTAIATTNGQLVRSIQGQRREQALTACQFRNDQNKGILVTLRRFHVTDSKVLTNFPIEQDCKAFARKAAP